MTTDETDSVDTSEVRKTALISGGTAGIGKGAVKQLLADGFDVVTFSRTEAKCETLRFALAPHYDRSRYLVCQGDVTDPASLETVVEETVATFDTIDVLINNAGIAYFEECDTVDLDRFQQMIETNIFGVAALTKLVVPHMKAQKRGLILNIASVSGKTAFPKGEFYSATKFAVMGYSSGIRKELSEFGIKVATLCAGMIATDLFSTEELARRKREWDREELPMLEVCDISRLISTICTQAPHCDIRDITVMPFEHGQ